MFNGLRYIVKTGTPWRWMSNDLPPWAAAYQQAQRWVQAGYFENWLTPSGRAAPGRRTHEEPSATVLDSDILREAKRGDLRFGGLRTMILQSMGYYAHKAPVQLLAQSLKRLVGDVGLEPTTR